MPGVEVICIAVGEKVTKNELKDLATKKSNVFSMLSMRHGKDILQAVRKAVCPPGLYR